MREPASAVRAAQEQGSIPCRGYFNASCQSSDPERVGGGGAAQTASVSESGVGPARVESQSADSETEV